MTTKDKIIILLKKNEKDYISGQQIANEIGISRNAVHKAINSLKIEGYEIESIPNKGYKIGKNNDVLSKSEIENKLTCNDYNITIFKEIDSTNTYLKNNHDLKDKTIVIANNQLNGKGRKGRVFVSKGSGIYMSILLKPNLPCEKAVLLTTIAALAVCNAIEENTHKKASIKWVNDVLIDNKKVCGILTEGLFDAESANMEYAIVGIGVNAYMPENIDGVNADGVFDNVFDNMRNCLIASIINNFEKYYSKFSNNSFFEEYKQRLCMLGNDITVIQGDSSYIAKAIDIDENCRLIVKTKDNEIKILNSGEISTKLF